MTAYFWLIGTDMIRQGVDADPHVLALLSAMPKFILKRIQPQTAAAAIADGLERRRRSLPSPAAGVPSLRFEEWRARSSMPDSRAMPPVQRALAQLESR